MVFFVNMILGGVAGATVTALVPSGKPLAIE
uniref:Uncharacterized protein n=1 Tax=Acinetobacter phage vB_Ab_1137_KEN_03 TaxID=3158853 RepID=A0AAU8KVD2_9CAUD